MRILRLLVIFCFVLLGLAVALLGFFQGFSYDFTRFFDSSENTSEEKVAGIKVNSLIDSEIFSEIILYLNGVNDPQVIRHKLSTSRERVLAQLSGSDLEYFFPGKIVIYDDDLYWIKRFGDINQIIRVKTNFAKQEEEVIYTVEGEARIIGMQKFDGDDVYFTQYLKREEEYNYFIARLKNEKDFEKIMEQEKSEYPMVVVGMNKDKDLILRNYSESTTRVFGNCVLASTLEVTGCVNIEGVEYWLDSVEPEESGYLMGGAGFIEIVKKKEEPVKILEGSMDEHFESLYYHNGFVYFVSGVVEPASSYLTDEGDLFGSFKPIAIERISVDGESREELKILPSSLSAQIKYVTEDYLLVSMSNLSSNKYDIRPANLWLYDLKLKDFEQLTDIDCEVDQYCEAVFLQEYGK